MFKDLPEPTIRPIPAELKRELSQSLEQYHRVFDTFWSLSEIYFGKKTKTACVAFPPGGRSHMILGEAFWAALEEDERIFVIIHECLHVLLDHGVRNARHIPGATPRIVNIAQDITINEMIVNLFSFPRGLLRDWSKYCWIETCFRNPEQIEPNQVFLYYLRKLIEQGVPEGVQTLDEHDDSDEGGYADDNDPDALAGQLAQDLSWDELQAMIKNMGPEGGRGISLSPFNIELERRIPPKVNFKDIVAGLKRSELRKRAQKEQESFARTNRRLSSSTMMLPGRVESKPDPDKLLAAVFFDVSGSCMKYIEHFSRIRQAFEEEEDLFETRTFAFDTSVNEVKTGEKLGIGGGTYFHIIEQKCTELAKERRYPDCVVVITDGAGNRVVPSKPGRWIWLLTPPYRQTYVPYHSRWFAIDRVVYE
jgi:predicted metal-dependent peptidase